MRDLRRGDHGEAVRALQAATNRRLRARDLDGMVVAEDGSLGDRTIEAVRKAAWALGGLKETYECVATKGVVPVGVQRMVLNPGRRNQHQLDRGRRRMALLRKQRRTHDQMSHKTEATSARGRAVNAFLAKVGTVEHPPGSNGGGIITVMETFWGFGRVPWCGISFGYHAKVFGGVDGLRSDVASVQAITNHAKARHRPYGRFQSDPRGAFPGSAVIVGGPGTHVEMLVQALADGSARTVGGNTSFGPGGSQSNGGCIAARVRSPQEIYGIATMNYPN